MADDRKVVYTSSDEYSGAPQNTPTTAAPAAGGEACEGEYLEDVAVHGWPEDCFSGYQPESTP